MTTDAATVPHTLHGADAAARALTGAITNAFTIETNEPELAS